MNSNRNMEKRVRNAPIETDPQVDGRVLDDVLRTFDETIQQRAAATRPRRIGVIIMRSKLTKLARNAKDIWPSFMWFGLAN